MHPVAGVTGLHVARYARQLDLAELSPASAARKLAAVSSWYAWLARRGHITASPAVGIARPRAGPDTAARPALTREQVLALVHAADTARGPQRARTADLAAHLGPSAMRRSFAALYLDSGGALHDLQSALGHADPRTTRRYERGRPARGHSPRPASAAARGGPCTLGPAARPGASRAETTARRFPR